MLCGNCRMEKAVLQWERFQAQPKQERYIFFHLGFIVFFSYAEVLSFAIEGKTKQLVEQNDNLNTQL